MSERWLRLFGPMQVEEDGRSLAGFRSQKALALLGYLAVEGRPVPRTVLAGLYWGEASEAQARRELRRVLHNLSERLPGCLQIDRRVVQFMADGPLHVDVLRAAALLEQGSLIEAVTLYQGDFMEGLFLDDCPEFEAWLLVQRERQRQSVGQALDRLLTQYETQGRFEEALTYARSLLELDNWREETHRKVMLLLARTGQISAALRQYEICRQILAEELAVEPSPETEALYERVRALRSVSRFSLPRQATPLIGREKELAQIGQMLADPTCHLLTLVGLGGIGKSRLAIEAGHKTAESGAFLEGIVFVRLAGLEAAEFLASGIIEALPTSLQGAIDPAIQLINYLRDKELLLILDNFEQLLPEGNKLLRQLIRAAPAVKFIVTSRSRLNLSEEWVYEVKGLTTGAAVTVQQAPGIESAAAQLYYRCAERVQPRLELARSDREQVTHICRLVEGMPLAIELSAAWLRVLSLKQIAKEMAQNIDFLTKPHSIPTQRHDSLRTVFDQSWSMLTADEQAVFQSLALFRGGFDYQAAQVVAGASPVILRALVDKSFLQWDGTGRYDIHELLRQYGMEKLKQAGELKIFHEKHARYFMELAESAEPELFGGANQPARLQQFDAELDNVRAALGWSLANNGEIGLRLAAALGHFWHVRGLHLEGRHWLGHFLEGSEREDPHLNLYRAKALNHIGWIAFFQRKMEEFFTNLSESVTLWRGLSDKRRLPFALTNYAASIFYAQADPDRSYEMGLEAVELARVLGDDLAQGNALFWLAHLSNWIKDYRAAEKYSAESMAHYKKAGDTRHLAGPITTLGRIALDHGNYKTARSHFQESMKLYETINDVGGISITRNLLGSTAFFSGALEQAADHFREEARIDRRMGNITADAFHLIWEAEIALRREEFAAAKKYSRLLLEQMQKLEHENLEGQAWSVHGQALEGLGDSARAEAAFIRGSKKGLLYDAILPSLAGLARMRMAAGELSPALEIVEDVMERMQVEPPSGKDDPFPIYLTCIHVLYASNDGRAKEMRNTAVTLINQRAASIFDGEVRNSFMNLPAQREIIKITE